MPEWAVIFAAFDRAVECCKDYGRWAAEENESKTFVGSIGLWYPERWPELELGYWLVPEAYGKGYGTEAGLKAKSYAIEVLRATTPVSYIDPDNGPSKKVAERLGASFDESIELLDLGPHCVYRYGLSP